MPTKPQSASLPASWMNALENLQAMLVMHREHTESRFKEVEQRQVLHDYKI